MTNCMKHFFTRTVAASISLTLLPVTTFAYSLNYFQLQKAASENIQDELQGQEWDTLCRDQLGIPGGDPLGALRFNLNRCINTHRRQANLQERNMSRTSRRQEQLNVRTIQSGTILKGRVSEYQRVRYQQRLRTRIEFRSTLPQTSNQEQKSFQYIRSRRRISVQAKERAIKITGNKRRDSIRKAREACVDLYSHAKAECIRENLKSLMDEQNEED